MTARKSVFAIGILTTTLALPAALRSLAQESAASVPRLLNEYASAVDNARPLPDLPTVDLDQARGQLAQASSAFLKKSTGQNTGGIDRRRVLTAFALELAEAGALKQPAAAARVVEWACPFVRGHQPIDDFDRAWELAALALMEGGLDPQALATHLDHMQRVMPDDPRLLLARGIVEEQAAAPSEGVHSRPRGAEGLSAEQVASAAGERALTHFQDAMRDNRVRGEAALRLGHVQLVLGRPDAALSTWAGLDRAADSPALRYLLPLFRGLAFDALGQAGNAEAAYRAALAVAPSAHSATMRLAALDFENGRTSDAEQTVADLLANDDVRRDVWWAYYMGDWRFWYSRITDVHTAMGLRGAPAPSPASRVHMIPAAFFSRQQKPVFRSRVNGVTIQASVRSSNRAVTGLTAADFELRDNGVVQEISAVSVQRLPIDVTFVLDLSASVDGAVLQRLVGAIKDTASLLGTDDRVRLITVSQVLHEVFGFQSPKDPMPLDRFAAEGATSLYDGVAAAMMRAEDPGRRQLAIAFTDGRDSTSILEPRSTAAVAHLSDVVLDIVVPTASASGASAPLVTGSQLPASILNPSNWNLSASTPQGTAPSGAPWARREDVSAVLATIAKPTGGELLLPDIGQSLSGLFKRSLDTFRASYVLQYVPTGVPLEGWHDVVVTIKRSGTYDVQSRKGYSGGLPLLAPQR